MRAHLLVPNPSNIQLPVFFNVDAVVGAPPAVSNREDVLLVQFAFNVLANTPKGNTPPDLLAAAKAVQVTGSIDPATINAIRTLQANRKKDTNPNTVVDGRVSPAKGYSYGAIWTIVELNNSMQDRFLNLWPRIDKIPGCPAELQQMVARVVVGK